MNKREKEEYPPRSVPHSITVEQLEQLKKEKLREVCAQQSD